MENIKISILITTFNAEKFISNTIESIIQQTHNNYEIIIIDNKSTDNTINIIKKYIKNKIILKCLDKNYGQTAALNIGLKLCTTDYILRLDADDIASPNRIHKQLSHMIKRNLDFMSSQVLYIDENGQLIGKSNFYHVDKKNIYLILLSNPIAHPSVIIKKDILIKFDGYNEKFIYWQDIELWMRLIKSAKFEIHPEFLTSIRIHKNALSKTRSSSISNKRYLEMISLIENSIKNDNNKIDAKYKVLLIIKRDILLLLLSFKFRVFFKLIMYTIINTHNIIFNKFFYLIFYKTIKNRLYKL
tara:strand:+ start:7169 stop:8071 length:903 start_codon:yes stop_codon:yes gene_type:complete